MQQSSNGANQKRSKKFEGLKKIDLFGPHFQMEIQKGQQSLKTGNGALLTIALVLIMVTYLYLRANVWLSKSKMFIN